MRVLARKMELARVVDSHVPPASRLEGLLERDEAQ